jgi:hypothetical protein
MQIQKIQSFNRVKLSSGRDFIFFAQNSSWVKEVGTDLDLSGVPKGRKFEPTFETLEEWNDYLER